MKIVQTNVSQKSYTSLDIESLSINDILVFHIFIKQENNYVIILEAGTTLSKKLYNMLETKGQLYVSKQDEDKRKLTYNNLFTYIKYNKHNLEKTLSLLYEVNNALFSDFLNSEDDSINLDSVREIVKSMVYLIQKNQHYLRDTIKHFSSDYSLPYHSIHVSTYAITIGYFLKLDEEQLIQLGIAGLMHDIGSKKVNDSIKTKDSKLDVKEIEAVQQHPKFSCDIAKKNQITDPYILDAILHHHESNDGTGYPNSLISDEISSFAAILCISDVFDALTNDRTYRKKHSSFEALKIMMNDESTVNKFNQKYLKLFLRSLKM